MKEWEVDSMQIAVTFQRKCVRWFVRRPALTFSLILIIFIIALSAVVIVGISPFTVILNYFGFLESSPGDLRTVYNILFNGFLLAVLLTTVIAIVFIIITCASIIHSHKSYLIYKPDKKCC